MEKIKHPTTIYTTLECINVLESLEKVRECLESDDWFINLTQITIAASPSHYPPFNVEETRSPITIGIKHIVKINVSDLIIKE